MWCARGRRRREFAARERNLERRTLDDCPGVRLVRVCGAEDLARGRRGESGLDALELCERFDGPKWDLAGSDVLLQPSGSLRMRRCSRIRA
jgi:hypothetical protein